MDLSAYKAISIGGVALKEIKINGVLAWKSGPTNQVPLSIDTTGAIYNGKGYKDGCRLSSGGTEKTYDNGSSTGYIPAKGGDVVRVGGCWWKNSNYAGANYVCAYAADFTYLGPVNATGYDYGYAGVFEGIGGDDEVAVITLANNASIAYIRVSCGEDSGPPGAKMIVTINEEIA